MELLAKSSVSHLRKECREEEKRDRVRDLFGGIHTLREWELNESRNQRRSSYRGRELIRKTQDAGKQVR